MHTISCELRVNPQIHGDRLLLGPIMADLPQSLRPNILDRHRRSTMLLTCGRG